MFSLLAPIAAEGSAAATVSSVLTDVGTVVTQAMTWAGNVVSFIAANPLIMVFVSLPLVGLGVGLIKRMISL